MEEKLLLITALDNEYLQEYCYSCFDLDELFEFAEDILSLLEDNCLWWRQETRSVLVFARNKNSIKPMLWTLDSWLFGEDPIDIENPEEEFNILKSSPCKEKEYFKIITLQKDTLTGE